jgi:hypothetical protein
MAKDFSIMPTGTIEAYINSAYQIPVLTPEEERSLARACVCATRTTWPPPSV